MLPKDKGNVRLNFPLRTRICKYGTNIMILRIDEDPSYARIIFSGEAGLTDAADLLLLLKESITEEKDLLIDISAAASLDFPVLQVLAAATMNFRESKRQIVLTEPPAVIVPVIALSGLEPFLSR